MRMSAFERSDGSIETGTARPGTARPRTARPPALQADFGTP